MTLRALALIALFLALGVAGRMDYEEAKRIEAEYGWTRKCVLDVESHWLRCEHYDATGRLRVVMDHCC